MQPYRNVADCQLGAHLALAAVLESDLGLDAARRIAGIERLHQRLVSLRDDPPAHLARAGQFAVIGVELLVQDQEPADLRRRQGGLGREVAVDPLDAALHQIVDRLLGGQFLVRGVGKTAPRGPRLIDSHVRAEMKKILADIQSGNFAREWVLENTAGTTQLQGAPPTRRPARDRKDREKTPRNDAVDRREPPRRQNKELTGPCRADLSPETGRRAQSRSRQLRLFCAWAASPAPTIAGLVSP